MTRIAVFGNSHVGAWKEGWDRLANDYPGLDVTFFGAPQGIYKKMGLDEQKVFAPFLPSAEEITRLEATNGRHLIDLSQTDIAVWAGFGWQPVTLARILKNSDIDGLRIRKSPTRISQSGFAEICNALAMSILPGPDWQNWDSPRLYVSLQPLYADTCLESTHHYYNGWQQMDRDFEGLDSAFDSYCFAIETNLKKAGIEFLAQPRESLASMRLTDKSFLANGGGLVVKGQEHKRGDHAHMNGDYGNLCWRALLDRLSI